MKRCPQCNRVESDEALKFCRVDGAPLVPESSALGDEAGTAQLGSDPSEVHTSIFPQKDKAFAALEDVYAAHSNLVGHFKVDPQLNPLRDDPRFTALLKKSGFPQ